MKHTTEIKIELVEFRKIKIHKHYHTWINRKIYDHVHGQNEMGKKGA